MTDAARMKALEFAARGAFARADEALHNAVALWADACTDEAQAAWLLSVGEAREALGNLRAALAALPAQEQPQPAGEVVEKVVQLVVCQADNDGGGCLYALTSTGQIWSRLPANSDPWTQQTTPIPATVERGE